MTAFADLSELLNRATGGNSGTPLSQMVDFIPRIGAAAATVTIGGRRNTLWRYGRTYSPISTTPGAVAAPTAASSGALPHTNPGGGRQRWLTAVYASASQPGSVSIYDRLLHISGLSGTTTTAQTVGGTLTRNTGGVGNQIAVEIHTAVGSTATTITASYTNSGGTASRTTQATVFGGTGAREAERLILLPLADGDLGVQSVQTVTVLASTTTAGDFGVIVLKPLVALPIDGAGAGRVWSLLTEFGAMPELIADACYAVHWLANTVVAPDLTLQMFSVER